MDWSHTQDVTESTGAQGHPLHLRQSQRGRSRHLLLIHLKLYIRTQIAFEWIRNHDDTNIVDDVMMVFTNYGYYSNSHRSRSPNQSQYVYQNQNPVPTLTNCQNHLVYPVVVPHLGMRVVVATQYEGNLHTCEYRLLRARESAESALDRVCRDWKKMPRPVTNTDCHFLKTMAQVGLHCTHHDIIRARELFLPTFSARIFQCFWDSLPLFCFFFLRFSLLAVTLGYACIQQTNA